MFISRNRIHFFLSTTTCSSSSSSYITRTYYRHRDRHCCCRCRDHRSSSSLLLYNYNKYYYTTIAICREIPNTFEEALSSYYDNHDNDDEIKKERDNQQQPTEKPSSSSSLSLSSCCCSSSSSFSISRAREQHSNYINTLLYECNIPVLCLPPLHEYADSIFVEDTVVVVGDDTAVITCPGHYSRQNEVNTIKDIIEKLGIIKNVYDMRDYNNINTNNNNSNSNDSSKNMKKAICDGGDVLYTGRHLFIGLSDRTNILGAEFIRRSLTTTTSSSNTTTNESEGGGVLHDDDIIIVPSIIQQGNIALHLKSIVTCIDEYTLVVPTGYIGDQIVKSMKIREPPNGSKEGVSSDHNTNNNSNDHHDGQKQHQQQRYYDYNVIRLDDMSCCNLISINNNTNNANNHNNNNTNNKKFLLAQKTSCSLTQSTLQKAAMERNMQLIYIDTSEIAKKDGALTCCSILLHA